MKTGVRGQGSGVSQDPAFISLNSGHGVFLLILAFALCSLLFALSSAEAKVYIDITSPGIRQLPVSIRSSQIPAAREIADIIKSDLEFTGLFSFVDPDLRGAELIADIDVDVSGGLKVILSLKDLVENREVLKKRYIASSVRPLAHSIA
ncbi:MAG: hypothetical protein HZC49_08330, partial [Nitrospirae bacterium]|nr:hypothetical protein [Nitrospirota bacterium]